MILSLLLVVLLITWAGYYRWSRRRLHQLSKQINNDYRCLPLIGHAYLFLGGGTGRMKALRLLGRETIKQGGIIHGWLGPELFLMVTDIEILDLVLRTCLEKHESMSFVRLALGNGSIFAPVSIWRRRRKIMALAFSPKNLGTFVDIFSKQSSIMVSLLKQAPKESFPIWKYFTTLTMDSIFETALAFESNAQKNPQQIFLEAVELCTQLIADRICKPWLHPLAVYKMTPQYASFMKHKTEACDAINHVVKTKTMAFKQKRTETSKKNVDKGFKSVLELILKEGVETRLTELELQEETLVLLVAGTDTSAVGASFTAVMLSRHQDVQEKVYQEVMEVLGDTDRLIVKEDLPRLKYLEAVIRETLRLHPPVPIIVRKTETDVTLPSGITLVKGCGIAVNIWAIHRDPKYWGPDAEDFRPERFLEHYDKRAFMAFSSGPRNCLGYQYAMMSMKTALASLVRQYRVLPAEEDIIHDGLNTKYKPIQESFEIMMKDVNKFMIKLKSRK